MTKEQYDYQIDFDAGGSLARRRTQLLTDGCYLFEDELEFEAVLTTTIITCAAWLVELYELRAGEVFFLTDTNEVRPRTKSFGVVYLPFSITQPSFNNPRGRVLGVAGTEPLPSEFAATPMIFETRKGADPTGMTQVFEILRSGSNLQSIDPHSRASFLSRKAKSLIDENYQFYPSIARIATRLGVSHAHLSRQFKRDYGMTPSDYFRKLRVADASLRLARGEEIINVSHDVGYNDLSRFYKQFRQTTNTSPGICKTMMRPKRASDLLPNIKKRQD